MHLMFNPRSHKLKVFSSDHDLIWECEAHGEAVGDGYHHDGECPPGDYLVGTPEKIDPPEVPFGYYFIPVIDNNGQWVPYARAGIGIHGGGTGLPDPFALHQGWEPTCGCLRTQNQDLDHLVKLIYTAKIVKEEVKITVS